MRLCPARRTAGAADPPLEARQGGVAQAVAPEVGVDHRLLPRRGHRQAERAVLAEHGDVDLAAHQPAGAVGPHLGGDRLLGDRELHRSGRRGAGRAQLLDEREELELGEDLAQRLDVRRIAMQGLGVERHLQIGMDGRQLLRQPRLLGVLLETLAVRLAGDLAGPRQEILQRAVLLDQPLGPLLADPRHARDVVDRVPHQGQDVGHLLGRHAEVLGDLLRSVELVAPGVVERDPGLDELHQVLVGGDQHHLVAGLGRAAGEGAQHVVRLVAGELQDGDAVGLQHPADQRDLALQVLRHRAAVRLVVLELVAAEGPPPLERHPDQLRVLLAQELLEHGHEAVDGVGGLAAGVREVADRVEGAEDVRVPVDQEQTGTGVAGRGGARLSRQGHGGDILCRPMPWPAGTALAFFQPPSRPVRLPYQRRVG